MRKLATIQEITSLSPIEGADRIELATVLGWQVIVQKGEFKVGDKTVYCEIDSILPEKSEFEFLRPRKFRIRTIKLKGQISQGICFPLSILPSGKYPVGKDVADVIGIKKYDPQAEAEEKELQRLAEIKRNRMIRFFIRNKTLRRFFIKPERVKFPPFIRKTDEDRIQLFPNICEDEKGTLFTATEKLDGSSATYFIIKNKGLSRIFKPYVYGVCSRNFQLIKETDSIWWKISRKYNIEKILTDAIKQNNDDYVYIQGEIIGPGVQGNPYKLKEIDFYVFNFSDSSRLHYGQFHQSVFGSINGLKTVPVIFYRIQLAGTIPETVAISQGKSRINPEVDREGLVWRNYGHRNDDYKSFKVINPEYLLKHEAA